MDIKKYEHPDQIDQTEDNHESDFTGIDVHPDIEALDVEIEEIKEANLNVSDRKKPLDPDDPRKTYSRYRTYGYQVPEVMTPIRLARMKQVVLLLLTNNMTQKEACERIGIHPVTFSRWKRRPEYGEIRNEIITEYMHDLTVKAVRTLDKLMNADSEHVRMQTASDILDRTGYEKGEKQNISVDGPVIFRGYDEVPD